MDGTGEHCAKGNKPGGERQVPCDLTFKCNLINKKTSKQNISRDIEIKNKLTVTKGARGEDNGGEGEGFSGTTIKDTWTKPRGSEIREGRLKWSGLGWGIGGKCRPLYLNNDKKKR